MGLFAKILLGLAVLVAAVMGYGWWRAATHAALGLQVTGPVGSRAMSLVYFDADRKPLASARSVAPLHYLVAVHPDPAIGDCRQHEADPGRGYQDCFARHSRWASRWAEDVRTADVVLGDCTLRALPVQVGSSSDWPTWWVPLPHVGGTPMRYVQLVVRVDPLACAAH